MTQTEKVKILVRALEEVLGVIETDGFYSDVEFIRQELESVGIPV